MSRDKDRPARFRDTAWDEWEKQDAIYERRSRRHGREVQLLAIAAYVFAVAGLVLVAVVAVLLA